LRVVSAAALLVVVAAGCGGAAGPQRPAFRGVPRTLAQAWEGQASAIAEAASSGDSCHALQLANSLRTDVRASRNRLPARLRPPLLSGVNALADRITCTPAPPKKQPKPKPEPPPKPHEHGHHGHHGHGGGGDGGDGRAGGNER
jgi:hypothetical protein